jgi:SAM-dependent methyltransferase
LPNDAGAGPATGVTPIPKALVHVTPWHFEIEILPSVWTHTFNKDKYEEKHKHKVRTVNPDDLRKLFKRYYPQGLKGKTFLDVGCNAGGYCFLAHELGADHSYGFDVRDHWIDQANFVREVKYPNASNIKIEVADLKAFTSNTQFDITLFKGVFYHLPDPIHDLLTLCRATRELIILDTATADDVPENCLRPIQESPTRVMSGVDGLAWLPGGPAAVAPILSYAGFPHMRTLRWVHGKDRGRDRGRMRVVAARNKELLRARKDDADSDGADDGDND